MRLRNFSSTTAVVPGKPDGAQALSRADPKPILTGRDCYARSRPFGLMSFGGIDPCVRRDDSGVIRSIICTTGNFLHASHVRIARHAILSHVWSLRRRANHDDASARPASSTRGVRVVTKRGVRDAMDVQAALDERAPARTAKSCGPDIPTLISSRRRCSHRADDGGQKARRTGEITYKPVNRRAGKAGCSARTCGSAACFLDARGPWVRSAPGLLCALYSARVIELNSSDEFVSREGELMPSSQLSSRPSERSECAPGPIATGVCCCRWFNHPGQKEIPRYGSSRSRGRQRRASRRHETPPTSKTPPASWPGSWPCHRSSGRNSRSCRACSRALADAAE
jgi:hypothetical protein